MSEQRTASKQTKKVHKVTRVEIKRTSKVAKEPAKQARSETPAKQWWRLALSVVMMLIWVGASIIVSQLLVGHIMLAILGAEVFVQPVPTAIYSALSYVLAMILIIIVPSNLTVKWKIVNELDSGKRVHEGKKNEVAVTRNVLGLRGWPTWTDIGLAPVGFIVYLILAAGVTALFSLFPWFDAEQVQDVGFSVYSTGLDRIIAFVVLVVVAPIAEEIIFRGWLYGRLREKFHGRMPEALGMSLAIFLVSLLFGIVHMQWNVGVNVFAMSIVLCGLREITGTIYAGILMHMIKNGVAFYMLYVLGVG